MHHRTERAGAECGYVNPVAVIICQCSRIPLWDDTATSWRQVKGWRALIMRCEAEADFCSIRPASTSDGVSRKNPADHC